MGFKTKQLGLRSTTAKLLICNSDNFFSLSDCLLTAEPKWDWKIKICASHWNNTLPESIFKCCKIVYKGLSTYLKHKLIYAYFKSYLPKFLKPLSVSFKLFSFQLFLLILFFPSVFHPLLGALYFILRRSG